MPSIGELKPLLAAIAFAARAHAGQVRKDGQTPYVSHPFRVAAIVRNVFGVTDPAVLQAAVLHDTIEDTTTDADDLIEHFGIDVAAWVGLLSKDKRLPEDERERQFMDAFSNGPWQVQIVKLGDLCDNLLDSDSMPAAKRERSRSRWRSYLDAMAPKLAPESRTAYNVVRQLYDEVAG